jgi:hypothetical protein
MPYQVGSTGDKPEIAITNKHQTEVKDIIILAIDGYGIFSQ